MPMDDIFDESRPPLYTRPYQLPPNVGFIISSYVEVEKRNTKEKTHKIVVKNDEFTSLMIYPGGRFPKMTEEVISQFNEEIKKGELYYLVARRWTSIDRVPLDIISESKRLAQNLPVYDCEIHTVKPVNNDGSLTSSGEEKSPFKKFKSDF